MRPYETKASEGSSLPRDAGKLAESQGGDATIAERAAETTKLMGGETRDSEDALRRLQLSEARWQAVLDTAQDAIISIDQAGKITLFNRSAERIFGYTGSEVLGKDVGLLMTIPHADRHSTYLEQYHAGGPPQALGRTRRLEAQRKDGEVFPIELSVSEARVDEEVIYTAIIRDVSPRMAIEEELRHERDFARRLVDTAPVFILVLDEEGRVVRFNPALAESVGYALEEVKGKDWFEIFVPADERERVRAMFVHAVHGQTIGKNVSRLHTRSGRQREIEWSGRTLRNVNGGVVGILTIGHDITERRQAERRLAAQHSVTRALAEAESLRGATPRILQALCGAMGWDLGELWQVDAASNVLRWAGFWHRPSFDSADFAAISRSISLSPGSGLPSRAWTRGVPVSSDDLGSDPDFLRAALARKLGLSGACAFPLRCGNEVLGVMVFFCRAHCKPGEEVLRLIEAVGHQIGDFMHRQQAQEELRKSEEHFALFMRHLPGIAFMKDLDGRFLFVNDTFEKLFHQRLADLRGKTDDDIWPPDIARQLRDIDARVLASGQFLQEVETLPHGDEPHQWLASKFPIPDRNGRPAMVAGMAIDITERLRAQAQVHRLEDLAQKRQRLADIGAITSQIVHDLGNPLAAISMQAQLIARRARRQGGKVSETIVKPAEQIVAKVGDLDALIREFLEFAREQRLNLACIDLGRFLHETVDLWAPLASEHRIEITLDLPSDLPKLVCDEEKLHRIFDNLIKNAIEAIDQGPGTIAVSLTLPDSDRVCFSVADTGPGVQEGLELFRLFGTTKANGTGLGLAIVRQIALAHEGGIEFASAQPHGAVFHVELPLPGPAVWAGSGHSRGR